MEQKINLEQILWDSFHKFGIPKPTHTLAEVTQKAVKDAMKEAVRQGLDLAAENAKAYPNSNGQWVASGVTATVNKQSIINVINLVE